MIGMSLDSNRIEFDLFVRCFRFDFGSSYILVLIRGELLSVQVLYSAKTKMNSVRGVVPIFDIVSIDTSILFYLIFTIFEILSIDTTKFERFRL